MYPYKIMRLKAWLRRGDITEAARRNNVTRQTVYNALGAELYKDLTYTQQLCINSLMDLAQERIDRACNVGTRLSDFLES